MRRFILCLSAACAVLFACQREDAPCNCDSRMITFGVRATGAGIATRAYAENTAASVQQSGFNVAAVNGISLMFNSFASYIGGVYLPEGSPYYFPASGSLDFYAAFPASHSVNVMSGVATLSYEQDADEDLLVCAVSGATSQGRSVDIVFDHALSLLRFKALGANADVIYKVTSVKVGAPSSALYSFSEGAWLNTGSYGDVVYSSAVTTLGSSATVIDGAVTVIPCIPVVSVEWSVYAPDGNTLIGSYSSSKSLGVALSMGHETTVILTLPGGDVDGISFSVNVNPWVSEEHNLILD